MSNKLNRLIIISFILVCWLASVCSAYTFPFTVFDSKPSIIRDLSGHGNDGVNYGSLLTLDGLECKGSDKNRVYTENTFNLRTNWSFSVWFNESLNDYSWNGIMLGYSYSGGLHLYFGRTIYISTNHVYYQINYASPLLYKWYLMSYTYSYTNRLLTIYRNGSELITAIVDNIGSPKSAGVGTYHTHPIDCIFKNFSGYYRVLTPIEITNMYIAGRDAPKDIISTNGLVAFYNMVPDNKQVAIYGRNGSGDIVPDESPSGNHKGQLKDCNYTPDGIHIYGKGIGTYQYQTSRTKYHSVFFWLKYRFCGTSQTHVFNDGYNSGNGSYYRLYNDIHKFLIYYKMGAESHSIYFNDFNDGVWHLVGHVLSNNTVTFYVDDQSVSYTFANPHTWTGTYYGVFNYAGGITDMDGKRVSIYDRSISPSEHSIMYSGGRDASKDIISTNDLIAFYPLKTQPDIRPVTTLNSRPAYIYDLSGNDNTGVVHEAVITADGVYMDDSYEYIKTSNKFYLTNDWSVSYWYYAITNNGANFNWTGISFDTSYQNGLMVALGRTFFKNTDATTFVWSYYGSIGVWRNLIVSHDVNTKTLKFYTNGVYRSSGTYTGSLKTDAKYLYIGGYGNYPLQYYKNVAIWKRTLTADEAYDINTAGRNAPKDVVSTNNLKLFYDFKP